MIDRKSALYHPIIMGLLCSSVGVVVGLYLFNFMGANQYNDGWKNHFYIFAGIAAFITSAFFWWLLIERKQSKSIAKATWTGFLSGLVAHYVCWYLLLLAANFSYWILGTGGSSLGEPPIDPLNALWMIIVYCFFSWVICGWITAPAGALIGGGYMWFLKKRSVDPTSPDQDNQKTD